MVGWTSWAEPDISSSLFSIVARSGSGPERALGVGAYSKGSSAPQHFLYFFPLPPWGTGPSGHNRNEEEAAPDPLHRRASCHIGRRSPPDAAELPLQAATDR